MSVKKSDSLEENLRCAGDLVGMALSDEDAGLIAQQLEPILVEIRRFRDLDLRLVEPASMFLAEGE